MRPLLLATFLFLAARPASAAPPPPPPGYIADAAQALMEDVTPQNFEVYAAAFASDLHVFLNDREIAPNKAAWIALQRSRLGKVDRSVIGHSEGWDSVFIVGQYDDRSGLPVGQGLIFDPRFVTRAERYQFGPDHLIHELRMIQGGGMPWRRGG
jgi:hypothetical protein